MINSLRYFLLFVCFNYGLAAVNLPIKKDDLVYWAADSIKKILSVDYDSVKYIDKHKELFSVSGFAKFKQDNQNNFNNIKDLSLSVRVSYKNLASVARLNEPDMWQVKLPGVISYFAKQIEVDYPVEITVILHVKLGEQLPKIDSISTVVYGKESAKLVIPRGCNLLQVR